MFDLVVKYKGDPNPRLDEEITALIQRHDYIWAGQGYNAQEGARGIYFDRKLPRDEIVVVIASTSSSFS